MFAINRPLSLLIKVCQKSFIRNIKTSTSLCNIMLKYSPNAFLNKSLLEKYTDLAIPECFSLAEYVWIDGTGEHLRSKTRTLDFIPEKVSELPVWTFDGSSTYQASSDNSEVFLCPRAMYKDPIRRGNNKLILCDAYTFDHKPTKTNNRFSCQEAMDKVADQEPWFGIEQEFTFLDFDGRPYGWPTFGFPAAQGPYYCAVGANKIFAREIIEALYRSCLFAGIIIGGVNAEVLPAQWEYQIGPALGMKCADDLWISRYLLHRIAEEYGVVVSLDPKPVKGWNGAGAHTNFSTKAMRDEGGLECIEQAIKKLSTKHKEHIERYDPNCGDDNKRRLDGTCETEIIGKFSSGVAKRCASIRIPRAVAEAKQGYFEDRRPAANCDPYSVCEAIIRTCLLDGK